MASSSEEPVDKGTPPIPLLDEESPLNTLPTDLGEALEEFRDNWQRELKSQQQHGTASDMSKVDTMPNAQLETDRNCYTSDMERPVRALSLFRDAVELEQRGKVYDALPLYRKALQIDPGVELRFYEQQSVKVTANSEINVTKAQLLPPEDSINEEDFIDDLYEKFQLDISREYAGKLMLTSRDSGVISTELHLSDLPPEIIMYILRWVVSAQLDMRSLEQCAGVCKGLYICARDDDIWRLACLKVWGLNAGTPSYPSSSGVSKKIELTDNDRRIPVYSSWRHMFIERERVLFSGCYISKTTYLRMGENSFQDQFYRPVQLVEYYRYLRFLPDSTVYMMTNADEPAQGVAKLKNPQQIRADVLRGRYEVNNDIVSVFMKKQRLINTNPYGRQKRSNSTALEHLTEYCIEFRIMSTPKRKFSQLVWLSYSVVVLRNNTATTSEFELTTSKYPPLWFSPVRSYHLDADSPLA